MRKKGFHFSALMALGLFTGGLLFAAGLDRDIQLDIPADSSLEEALLRWGKETHMQVMFSTREVAEHKTAGVKGTLPAKEALVKLLQGSGLTYEASGDTVVVGHGEETLSGSGAMRQAQTEALPESKTGDSADSSGQPWSDKLGEIVVTAQKKLERLQDVPVPVSVIDTQVLSQNGRVLLQDYYSTVPGLNLTPNYEATQILSIRGITTGDYGNPTVGVTIDGVPFGQSNHVPDLDPGDLARIEVLRGPQGTLYGAFSMGGLVNFITAEPSTVGYTGRVEAGISGVQHGDEGGFNLRASGNFPLSDTLALRASAFKRQDPGYIDNPVLNRRGVNQAQADGGRLAALWHPSENLSLKLSALYQDIRSNGNNEVTPPNPGYAFTAGLGELQQNYIPGAGAVDNEIQAYSATLNYKLGNTTLTSITGYSVNRTVTSLDYTWAFGFFTNTGTTVTGPLCPSCGTFPGFGVTGTPLTSAGSDRQFTQEFRGAGTIGSSWEWQLGAYYQHNDSPGWQAIDAQNATTAQIVGRWLYITSGNATSDYAGFANLTYRFNDRFDVQIGGRQSHHHATTREVDIGPYVPVFQGVSSPNIHPATDGDDNAFTYQLAPRLKLSPDLMLYARIASGYRPGGANNAVAVAQGAPAQSAPDKTKNYEIGVKGDFLHHSLSIDSSIYYIDWKSIQIQRVLGNGFGYTGNGGAAKSEGIEFAVTARPLTGLAVSGWVDYDKAILAQDIPVDSAYGLSGDRLPHSSKWSGNVSLEQSFVLRSGPTAFVGGMWTYVGDRIGDFQANAVSPRQVLPSYARLDLHAGIKNESWTINAYLNNVTDKRGILDGGIGYATAPFAFIEIQPRTFGFNISKAFGN